MIRRWSALSDQPSSMNVAARWSSSSGWVGGSLRRPKSPGVATRGVPKWCIQTRLTSTRAVSGIVAVDDGPGQLEPAGAFAERSRIRVRPGVPADAAGRPRPGCWDCRAGTREARREWRVFQADGPGRCAGALGQPVLDGLAELLELRLRRAVGQERQVAEGSQWQVGRSVRAVEDLAKLLEGRVGQRRGLRSRSSARGGSPLARRPPPR